MSRKVVGALGAVLAAILVITPYFLGNTSEKSFRAITENPAIDDFVAVEILSYDRGWFSSEVEISISPEGFLETYLNTMADALDAQRALVIDQQGLDDDGMAEMPVNPLKALFPFQRKFTLHHGPYFLTGGPGVGLARLSYELDFVEFMNESMTSIAATGPDKLVTPPAFELADGSATFHSWVTIGFDGVIKSRSDIPSGSLRIERGARQAVIEWAASSSTMQIDLATGAIVSNGTYGPATFASSTDSGEDANATIAALTFSMEGEFRSIWSYIGDVEFAWGGFSLKDENGREARLTDLSSTSSYVENAENSALTDTTGNIRLSEFAFESEEENVDVGPINVEFSYKNMDMTAYGQMMEKAMALQGAAQPNGQLDQEAKDQIMAHIGQFIIAGPEIEIAPISVATGSGDMEMTVRFSVEPGTIFTETDNFLGAIAGTTGEYTAVLDESLALVWASTTAEQQLAMANPNALPDEAQIRTIADQILASYTSMGLIEKDGETYRANVSLSDGKVFVGGQMMFDLAQQAANVGVQ